MTRLFAHANYDFIGVRRYAYMVTGALFLLSAIALAVFGLNYSIEFTGGTLIQIGFPGELDVAKVREGLDASGIPGSEIQGFGPNEWVIRARVAQKGTDPNNTQATADAVARSLDQVLGKGSYTNKGSAAVGPKVGGELRQKALLAIIYSFGAVLAYLAYRFEWRFGVAAVAATAHDIILTIGFISLMRLEVSLVVVGAVLSMVGYSLNDTIIIFDRVRENLRKLKREDFPTVLNRSVNETLPRSVLTHGTSLSTLLALAIFGGEVIRPFALVMFFGVFTGTFSSIYIASPVLMWIEQRWPGADARGLKGGTGKAPTRVAQPVG
jgi:preprotein translocase subunit SecF